MVPPSTRPVFSPDDGLPSRRSTISGDRHAISCGHHLAAAAGFAVLEAGGNAVDAGCCAGIALAVLHPSEVNFAGIAPIMYRPAGGEVVNIDGVGTWPQSFPADLFMREHGGEMSQGEITHTVVPAAPSAWLTALRDHGTMSFGEIAEAAIRFARDGFPVFPYFSYEVEFFRSSYERFPDNAAIFLPGGRVPEVGDRFVQRDLAATIEHMVEAERAASGHGREAGLDAAHDAFYRGDIARAIVACQEDNGGYLSRDDLAEFRVRYEKPVQVRWRDLEFFTCGPWSQGPVLAQCLRTLERGEERLAGLEHNSAAYVHLVTEVMKGAFADREHFFGDPRHVDVPLAWLLSDEHVDARLRAIADDSAYPEMPPPIGAGAGQPDAGSGPVPPAPDTSQVSVIDRWGNAFSATPSDCSWGAPVVPGTGIVPSVRGVQSRPNPSHPSGVGPGRRPRVTPNSTIAVRADGSVLVLGCPGGDMQVQAMLQFILNSFHFGMDIQDAISAPRFSTWSFPNSFAPFSYLPNRLGYEGRIDAGVAAELAALGHELEQWPDFTRRAAAVEVVFADRESGFLRAGADPRQPAGAIAG